MPEINNALALGIKNEPIDVLKPLLGASQINESRARTGLIGTETAKNQAGLRGQAANIIYQDPSDNGVNLAIKHFEQNGTPLDTLTKQNILKMNPEQRKQTAYSIMQGSMPSQTAIEQNPSLIAQRAQSQTGGTLLGSYKGPPGYQPAAPSQKGAEPTPSITPLEEKGAAEASTNISQDQLKKYSSANEAAANQKVALRQIMLDAEKVRTGQGAEKEQAARKWFQAAAQYLPGLKNYSPDQSIAAFESIEKNKGIVAREAMKSVGGTAASELSSISDAIVGGTTSHGGIVNNASQLMGMKNAEMARYQAAHDYFNKNQTLKGFDAHFSKNAGPAAWVYMALPQEERQSIRDTLKKSKQGQGVLNSIARQMNYIHSHKLDEGLD